MWCLTHSPVAERPDLVMNGVGQGSPWNLQLQLFASTTPWDFMQANSKWNLPAFNSFSCYFKHATLSGNIWLVSWLDFHVYFKIFKCLFKKAVFMLSSHTPVRVWLCYCPQCMYCKCKFAHLHILACTYRTIHALEQWLSDLCSDAPPVVNFFYLQHTVAVPFKRF